MSLRKVITQDKNLQLIQDNVDDAIRPLQKSPLSGAIVVSNVNLIAGQDNLVSHGLGTAPSLWMLAALNANSVIWSQGSTELSNLSSNRLYINLRCTANCTVNLLFA